MKTKGKGASNVDAPNGKDSAGTDWGINGRTLGGKYQTQISQKNRETSK